MDNKCIEIVRALPRQLAEHVQKKRGMPEEAVERATLTTNARTRTCLSPMRRSTNLLSTLELTRPVGRCTLALHPLSDTTLAAHLQHGCDGASARRRSRACAPRRSATGGLCTNGVRRVSSSSSSAQDSEGREGRGRRGEGGRGERQDGGEGGRVRLARPSPTLPRIHVHSAACTPHGPEVDIRP